MGQGLEGWIFDPSQGRKLWEELHPLTQRGSHRLQMEGCMGETVAQPLGGHEWGKGTSEVVPGQEAPTTGKGSALLVTGVVEWGTRRSSESRNLGEQGWKT